MSLSDSQLDEHIQKRELICFARAGLDSNKIQGFPIGYSSDLLLLRYVFDFHIDGLLLIRREDISDSSCRSTDKFQRKMLEDEKVLKDGHFRMHHDIDSFFTFLDGLGERKIVIVENEIPPKQEFYIGRVVAIDPQTVNVHEFSGAGKWAADATEVSLGDITSCQIETNYINFYARHFQRATQ